MAIDQAPPVLLSGYPAIFRDYVVKNTAHILARVQQAGPILASAEREQALHTLSFALNLVEAWPAARELLLTMAPKMEQAGFRDEWMPYLEQGIAQSRTLADLEAEAELHFQLGRLYRLRGKFAPARTEFEAGMAGFAHLKLPRSQARAMNRLAQVARRQRQFTEAVRLAETALSLLGEQETERAYSYLVLGTVAIDKRDWPQAVEFFQRSFALWERENDQRMMGRSLMSLGSAWRPMKKYQEAIDVYRQAIVLFKTILDPIYQAIVQMNLGNVYYYNDQPEEALHLHLQAERIFRRVQDLFYLGLVNHNIGMAYRKMEQWHSAEEAYLLSIEQRKNIGNVAGLLNSMDGLGLVYLGQGQPSKAMSVFETALDRLTGIKGEPGYDRLVEMITSHLQEASEKIALQWT